jgi:Mlc titration factor MtfA (ptsG expression regulator)
MKMFQRLNEWWQERIVRRSPITQAEWNDAFQQLPLLQRLDEQEKARLKRLAILFLYYKTLEGAGELEVTTSMELAISLQACLPILNLGLHWYDGWIAVILYPGAFSRESRVVDEYGVEHIGRTNLSGESWHRGPVVLSWDDALHHGGVDGRNVVIHEFAHKLDMRNGSANGFPPLHKGMSAPQWAEMFTKAYADLELRIEQHNPIPINHYASTSPGEFFAVFTELFFEKPETIREYYPDIYDLLVQFYHQDPMGTSLTPSPI